MGLIKEKIYHPTLINVDIIVDEHSRDEVREPYDIINLDIAFSDIKTPDDLIELGKWCVEQGERIKDQYTPKGKSKIIKQ